MKFKSLPKKRRGLSSIVGALLFVVLMVAAFAVIGVALDSQTNIASTSRDVAAKDLEKQQEDFVLNRIRQGPTAGDFLEIELTNKGQNTAEMFTVIMTNRTDIGEPTRTFEIPSETSFLTVGAVTATNIVKTLNLKMDIPAPGATENYGFKVISSLGTVKTMDIQCDGTSLICGVVAPPALPGTAGLSAQLFLDGPNGINTKISTIIMFVQNTGTVPLEDVYPTQEACLVGTFPTIIHGGTPIPGLGDFTCAPPNPTPAKDAGCGSALTATPNNDGNGVCLGPGQTAIFKWDGTVAGDVGDVFTFCNSAAGEEYDNTPVGPTPLTCDTLDVIDPNDCGGCGTGGQVFILIDDLLIRPSLFMTIPSPWGSTGGVSDKGAGLWGVNVVNPTERPMTVNKITIVAFPPGATPQDVVIPSPCNAIEEIAPIDGSWSCPRINTILWQDVQNPLGVDPYSSRSFLVKLDPGKPTGGTNIDALIVQANAQTNFGSFGKADYQSSMFDPDEGIANVFLTNSTTSSIEVDAIQSQVLGLIELEPMLFNITIADMDLMDNTFLKDGTRLIINIPREWTDVIIADDTNFKPCLICSPDDRIAKYSDNSHQIVVETDIDIGGDSTGSKTSFTYTPDAITLKFWATPPLNDPDGTGAIPERLYIMYVLGDGETGTTTGPPGFLPKPSPIGPLMEIAIQVLQP